MGRNKKNDSEILVKFAREYFETEGEGNISKLKCSNFARYAEKHGSDAKAYDKADAQELLEARDEINRLEVRIRELERDNRQLTLACRFMRKMLKKYLYPSVANELLKQEKIPVTEDTTVCADAFDELIEAKFPEAFKGIQGTVQEYESKQDRLFRVMEEQVKDGFK